MHDQELESDSESKRHATMHDSEFPKEQQQQQLSATDAKSVREKHVDRGDDMFLHLDTRGAVCGYESSSNDKGASADDQGAFGVGGRWPGSLPMKRSERCCAESGTQWGPA